MSLIYEGDVCQPTIIGLDNGDKIKTKIERHLPIMNEYIAEALAKGNEIVIKCHNNKIFLYELKYEE